MTTLLSLAVIAAVLYMSVRLSKLHEEHRCLFCGTRDGRHAKGCQWER